ncbi:MAG: Holliday junction branch migration protein RuvA [Candidatus Kerfeldbacteria bacterium]|nr:Holliday junction branch migration protein RuvA [Candidatus Kerfeldbacteria bacterium]
MIASLAGIVAAKGDRFLVVETGGLGYRVFVTVATLAETQLKTSVHLFTHHHVAENVMELYGFRTNGEVRFFELLLGISGVGPKTALNVLSVATLDELRQAIHGSDATLLTKVSGVGKKTAERIVLELGEKIQHDLAAEQGTLADDAAVLDALVALGYSRNEARQAVRSIPKTVKGVSDRVREALKRTGRHGA